MGVTSIRLQNFDQNGIESGGDGAITAYAYWSGEVGLLRLIDSRFEMIG
jgi:hypothetical protein